MPLGTLGFRWQEKKGEWNLQMKDGQDGSEIAPVLSLQEGNEDVMQVLFDDFSDGNAVQRGVPVRYLETSKGRIPVTTIYDLIMAQFGVNRGLLVIIRLIMTVMQFIPLPGRRSLLVLIAPMSSSSPASGHRQPNRPKANVRSLSVRASTIGIMPT